MYLQLILMKITNPLLVSPGPPISDSLNTPTVFPATTATSTRRSNSGGSGDRISLIRETLEPLQGCSGGRQSLKRSASEIERPAAKKKATNSNGGGGCLVSYKQNATPDRKSHGEIVFVRSRIFYARPTHNKKRGVQFGLPHIRMPAQICFCVCVDRQRIYQMH